MEASSLVPISTPHLLISIKSSIPRNMELLSDTTKIHTLLCILPDNSIHQPVSLLQTHNSLQAWFWKQGSKIPFSSEPVDSSHSHGASVLHDRDAQVHYQQATAEWNFILFLPSQLKQFFSLPLSSCNHSLTEMWHPACSISITFAWY